MTRVTTLRWSRIGRKYNRILSDETRVTRRGLRKMLVAIKRHDLRREPVWYQIWAANRWAYSEAARTWHVRIPARYADADRTRVAAILGSEPLTTDQRRAAAWAERRWS